MRRSSSISRGTAIPILMYHHVVARPPRGTPSRYLFVEPRRFRAQMRLLKLLGYRGCSMAELAPHLRGEASGKVVGITFDDGFRNVYDHALPVLEECGFTATTYFVSRQVNGHNAWDTGFLPQMPCMTKAELRDWQARGQEVGAHTLDHERLAALPIAAAERQIAGSKAELEDMIGRPVEAFSYPYGSFSEAVVEMARGSGFTTGTTTLSGKATATHDPLRLPRMTVGGSDGYLRFLGRKIF
ncbi:polysaccharide deacetylase [Aureimonas endophytica]|uniref:Chitooligosaccharide deacetylase n=1 Tax=Aureimonas endophytica TaxID=2027858 RepID=A0A917E075_9HYPH|nr:polysaccharide deacetylase family protein [Aureimonas endophytica]GGD90035.1 polysaccharide deacetylase [Aureimonas endophytica]